MTITKLPTGTVTFLFTDIEGSTRLARQNPATWETAHARHHTILHAAIAAQHGYVFEVVGDGFCAAFGDALAAVHACMDAQRALHAEPWGEAPIRVRMGLHTGAAEARDRGYHGYLTLAHVQRIMSLAHGGQVLLSSTTAQLLHADAMSQEHASIDLLDLGTVRLKDFTDGEHIYQLVVPEVASEFPAIQAASTIPNNLPVQLTSFIGRRREILEVKRILDTTRLLTLTGSGGIGKTRLSLQVAADLLEQYPDGVWFIELAPLADAALVAHTVCMALGLREEEGRPRAATLGDYLRPLRLLLVLDNCEHLLEACARLADSLLHAAPQLKILASSREGLGIAGETTFHVPALDIANPQDPISIPEAAQYAAVELFVERARAAKTSFALTPSNAPSVVQICYRLDGIPLAIELAAARIRAFSPEQISARLDDRFRLLTGGSRTALPRQQTLRSTIDWSYSLLSEPERILLRRLSVFTGGWTLSAAEAVCSLAPIDSIDVADRLARLVEKSLVTAEEQAGDERYHLLETIRQYAAEKLIDANEAEPLRNRHLVYFAEFSDDATRQSRGARQAVYFGRLELEHANLRTAAEWGLQSNQAQLALRVVAAGPPYYWWLFGYENEWMKRLDLALAHPQAAERNRLRAQALNLAGGARTELGRSDEALPFLREALAIGHELDDNELLGWTLMYLAATQRAQADHQAGLQTYAESLRLMRAAGNQYLLANILYAMGDAQWRQGDFAHARAAYAESVAVFTALGDVSESAYPLRRLAYLAQHAGETKQAVEWALRCLSINQQLGQKPGILASLTCLGCMAIDRGRIERAVRLFAVATTLADVWHVRIGRLPDREELAQHLASAREQLDPVVFEAAWAEGAKLTLDHAIAEAEAVVEDIAQAGTGLPKSPATA